LKEQTMKRPNQSSLRYGSLLACLLLALLFRPVHVSGQVVQAAQAIPYLTPYPEAIELGPVLDVIPCVLSDGFTINLTLIPTLMDFVGYDNPNEVLSSAGALPTGTILVPTVLPRFRVRQVITTVNVWDGQTVVLGGLITENVSKIKDKVPMLGDIPVLGRLFRSESSTSEKKNLMIFVTPTIIDPAGNRSHSEDEMPFAQTGIPAQPKAAGPDDPQPLLRPATAPVPVAAPASVPAPTQPEAPVAQ
jgi:type II secretory pathway component GspD/PulD (secretin)